MKIKREDIEMHIRNTIQYAYNSYNGVVNYVDNISFLNLLDAYINDDTSNFARTSTYGFIYISVKAIADYIETIEDVKIEDIRALALEVIIHELTHIDQLIDSNYIVSHEKYRNLIERQCQKQTAKFFIDNKEDLENMFVTHIDIDRYKAIYNANKDVEYLRKQDEFIASYKVESLVGQDFKYKFKNKNACIIFIDIDDKEYTVQFYKDDVFLNTEELSKLLEHITLRAPKIKVNYFYIDNTLNIEITPQK